MKKQHSWLRSALAVLLIVGMLLTVGCGKAPSGTADPTTDNQNTQTDPKPGPENGNSQTEPVLTPEELAQAALTSVRQAMVETPYILAVAHFGYFSNMDGDPLTFIRERSPQLCEDLPFLTMIPQENIAGYPYGEVYGVIPADPQASITVRTWGINENDEEVYEEVVYQQEDGAPFLLFCNAGWSPDTQVTITLSDGRSVIWYPMLDKNMCVAQLWNENEEGMILDISAYAETLAADYFTMLNNEDAGWELPVKEDLIDTSWSWEGYVDVDQYAKYQIVFQDGIADIRWNDGIDLEDHEYSGAPWELTYEDGFAVLTIDFDQFAGVLRYNLLIGKEYDMLFTMMDASTGHVDTGLECLYRFLTERSLNAPLPTEMIGTWDRYKTSVEGYEADSAPGACTIQIFSSARGGLLMSYTDRESPNFNFQDEILTLDERELHTNCGNDEWVMDVDFVGPYDTTYAITLTGDGILIKQNYFLLDGAPSVSYEYFYRIEE